MNYKSINKINRIHNIMGIRERKERERERRRQQIMVAAKKVFSTKGFTKTTMEDIAHKAELSPGTLYLYFKNKNELYASMSLRILHYMLIRMRNIDVTADLTAEGRVHTLKEALLDVYEFDPLILVNMFHLQSGEALKNLTPQVLADIRELSASALGSVAGIFEEGIQNGDFAKWNPDTVADIVWAMFSGIVLWAESKKAVGSNQVDLKTYLETAFEIFGRGMRK